MSRNHSEMRLALPAIAAGIFLAVVAPLSSFAQGGPPGAPGGAPGGGGMRGGMRAPLTPEQKAWQEKHKNVMRLRGAVRALGRLDTDPKTALNKDQARKILAIIKANQAKPVITDDQAKKINDTVFHLLSPAQQTALLARPQRGMGGPGGGRPGGPGGPGGPGTAGAGAPRPGTAGGSMLVRNAAPGAPGAPGAAPGGGRGMGSRGGFQMKEYNPLNPDTLPGPPQMHERAKKGMDDLMMDLTARAK